MSSNPLQKYFRVPGIEVLLPSKGSYNNYNTSMNGDIQVFPFTTEDELFLVNPDSLLNGSALENMVKSCCPGITESARKIPMEDINAILLAAKYSTYGDSLSMKTTCPSCKKETEMELSIMSLIRGIKYFPSENILQTGDGLKIYLQPLSLEATTKVQLSELQSISMLKALTNQDINEEEKSRLITPSIVNMVHTAIDTISMGVQKIVVENDPEDIVISDFKQIKSFIEKIPASLSKEIRKKQEEFSGYGVQKDLHLTCPKCKHEWDSKLDVDPTSFFDRGS